MRKYSEIMVNYTLQKISECEINRNKNLLRRNKKIEEN